MNKTMFTGNLGSDPEMRYLGDGTAVTSFSVASNRSWKDRSSGERVKETTWYRVSAWGATAEFCNQYLRKGRKVLVEGRLTPDENGGPRVFTRNDGSAGASYEIRALNVEPLDGPSDGDDGDAARPAQKAKANTGPTKVADVDDIPF